MMAGNNHVADPNLESGGRHLARPSIAFGLGAIFLAALGVVLVLAGSSWTMVVGIVLIALAGLPAVIGMGLLSNAAVSRWSARRRTVA
jgi:hypothetical protein